MEEKDVHEKLRAILGHPKTFENKRALQVLDWALEGNVAAVFEYDPYLWYCKIGLLRLVERGYKNRNTNNS